MFILKSVFHSVFWNIVHLLMKSNSCWCYVSHIGCMKAFSRSLISVVYSSEAAREQFHAQQPLCVASCWCLMWLDMKVQWTKPGFMWAHLLAPCMRQNRRGHIDVVRIMLSSSARNPLWGGGSLLTGNDEISTASGSKEPRASRKLFFSTALFLTQKQF